MFLKNKMFINIYLIKSYRFILWLNYIILLKYVNMLLKLDGINKKEILLNK